MQALAVINLEIKKVTSSRQLLAFFLQLEGLNQAKRDLSVGKGEGVPPLCAILSIRGSIIPSDSIPNRGYSAKERIGRHPMMRGSDFSALSS